MADWPIGRGGGMRKDGSSGGQIVAGSELPREESDMPEQPSGLSQLRSIPPVFMTVPEVAHLFRVSDKTVRRLVNRGLLPRCGHLGKVLIPRYAVEKWILDSTKG
jgi:excisionase family DNA binding protein